VYFQYVYLPILYAEKVLDHKQNGLISLQEASKDPTFQIITGKLFLRRIFKALTTAAAEQYNDCTAILLGLSLSCQILLVLPNLRSTVDVKTG
jgi:hypothetical protein